MLRRNMSMFCPNCGTELPDDSVFCGNCGQRVDEEGNAVQGQPEGAAPVMPQAPAMQQPAGNALNKNGKLIGIVAGGVAAVVIIAVILLKVMGGGYTKPLDKACKLINSRSTKIESYVDAVCPKFMANAYKNGVSILKEVDEFDESMDELEDGIKDSFDYVKDNYGSNFKVKYEILDKEKLSKSELKKIKNSYKDLRDTLEYFEDGGKYYSEVEDELNSSALKKYDKLVKDLSSDLKEIKVTEGYRLEVNMIITGKEDEDEEEMEFNVIKVNNKWCVDFSSGDLNIISNMRRYVY